MDAKHIGRIQIHDDHSTLDLPADMSPELIDHLKTVWVAGQQLRISRAGEEAPPAAAGVSQAPGTGKSPFAKKTGGDRRFEEKTSGKPAAKPHRKGPKIT
jgi:ATP-dependent RNA helicase DeaD